MAQLRWTPQAVADLDEICEYIARDSPQYASIFAHKVVAILESMATERLPGSMVPEFGREDIRERLLHSYRIIVRLKRDTVEVLRIFHGARRLTSSMLGER